MEQRQEPVLSHIARFAVRWGALGRLKREKVTIVLSPHLDDIFMSLYATILSGKLGKNIVGINFFTATDSHIKTRINTDFELLTSTTLARISEELEFSRHLLSHGISYLPTFLGLKDAAVQNYYRFVRSSVIRKLPEAAGIKASELKRHEKFVVNYTDELGIANLLKPLIKQFGSSVGCIVGPMSVGTHIDHTLVSLATTGLSTRAKLGLYAEIPYVYLSGNLTTERLRGKAPSGFTEMMLTKFDPKKKDALLKRIYPSQYESMMRTSIYEASKLGEAIFWKNKE